MPSKSEMVNRPIWIVVRGVELVPDVDDAGIQRHRRGLQLERAARLVHAGHRAVEPVIGGRVAEIVGVVVGQADHRQHLARVHVHHDAAAADRLEEVHRLGQLVAHHGLHAHVDRQPQRRAVGEQPLVEELLDAGDAVLVDVDAAEHLRGGAAHRIVPLLGGPEIDPGNAESVDGKLLARRDLALEIDELPVGLGQARRCGRLIEARQHLLQPMRRIGGIDDLARIGEHRDGRQRDRQDLAIAVGDHRPLGERCRLRRLGAC